MHAPTFSLLSARAEGSEALEALSLSLTNSLGAEWDGSSGICGSTRVLASRKPVFTVREENLAVYVFGDIHGGDMTRLERAIHGAASAADAASALAALTWGSYVAFLEDRSGAYAFRDPSGAVPLYVAAFKKLQIASTRITPRLLRAAGLDWRIDVSAVAKLLAIPPAAAYLPGLSEIAIAVPGRLVKLEDPKQTRTIWSPAAIARTRVQLAPERLARAADAVLAAMAKPGGTGVELSGGFDSSAVFSCLARLGIDPKPFNFATAGRGGDEAHFAKDVATQWDIQLRTYASASELPDYRAFDAADHGVQPILHGLDSVFAKARQDMIDRERVTQVMTGQGGDALFYRLPTRLVALDRRRELGFSSLFTRSILDDARRVNGSIWSVLTTALGRRTGDDRPELEWALSHLLGQAATIHLKGPQPMHPWLDTCHDLSPGKAFHLMMLSHCQLFHGGRLFAPSVPMAHPLLAQPLIELTLACPTYILQTGPIDRGLARLAFGDRLPRSILRRRSKGEASDHYARAVLHNRDWLRDHLLGGRLTAVGLLDPVALEQALEPNAMRLGTDYRAFVQYASLESWMRYWT